MRKSVFAGAVAAIVTTGASAAYLSDVHGTVLVNGLAVPPNAEVMPGDRVKAVSGPASIVYRSGKVVTVRPGQTVVVLGYAVETYIVAPPGSSGPNSPAAR